MTLKTFVSKLNWRLVLMHLLACCFFVYAFKTLIYAFLPRIIEAARQPNEEATKKFIEKNFIGTNMLLHFYFWDIFAGLIGMLIAFIVSLIIAKRRHWYWLNSLIVFIAAFLLNRYYHLGWDYLKQIFWYPGGKLTHSITLEFIINSTILLGIGLFIFLSAFSRKFIEKKFAIAI